MTQTTQAAPRRVSPPAPAVGLPRRIDLGRLTFVPLAVLLLLGNVVGATRVLQESTLSSSATAARLTTSLLTAAFYVLLITLYLRRGSARATTASRPAKVAAVTGCWLPLALPLVGRATEDVALLVLANVLVIGGTAGALWSLRTLGRSFSVLPQARALVTSGPYALVRHPLYLTELVAGLGLVVAAPTALSVLVWLVIVGLQVYRMGHEERVLEDTLPEYARYRVSTYRLVPGLY